MAEQIGRILVVDDDRRIRALVSEVLAVGRYEVREARNGREALDVLARWRPDVITMGLRMPEMDGRTFLEERHKLGAAGDVPVIILTASSHLRDSVPPAEAAAFLTKPFVPRALLATIADVRARQGGDHASPEGGPKLAPAPEPDPPRLSLHGLEPRLDSPPPRPTTERCSQRPGNGTGA